MRAGIDPFSEEYEPFIIAGLLAFDMGRMMGKGDRYTIDGRGFRSRLRLKMRSVRQAIGDLPESCLDEIDLSACASAIETAYDRLAEAGEDALNADQSDRFHVGATKILHWIAPALFIMIDTNVAAAFRKRHGVNYRKSTQPGYTAKKYLEWFTRIEPATPTARLFDKAAWIAGLFD